MGRCRYKKIIQFYLDGWVDVGKAGKLEEHLKSCAECQLELAELEELNLAASEIIEEAPDRGYWGSFHTRVLNRILARNIEPVQVEQRASRRFNWRAVSVVAAVIVIAGAALVMLSGLRMRPSHYGAVAPTLQNQAAERRIEPTPVAPQASAAGNIAGAASQNSSDRIESGQPGKPDGPKPAKRSRDIRLASLEEKEPTSYFREAPSVLRARPELKFELEEPSLASTSEYDESYRLRGSFLNQRLLSDIGPDILNGPWGLQGTVSGRNGTDGGLLRENGSSDVPVTWGYAKVPDDTSKSEEMKRYYIELDLMQAK